MKIFDISMTIEPNIMVYKNYESKKPIFSNASNFNTGNHYETDLKMNLHTGTHIDAPLHMIRDGLTMEHFNLNRFMTKVKVLDLTHVSGMITRVDLKEKEVQKGDFLLFKTKNSFEEHFNNEFISLSEDGAAYLAKLGIQGVGTDGLGIERDQPEHGTHKRLFNADIMIIEGLRLRDIEEGIYDMIALPLKLADVEASPARVVLMK
ncbi:cyclase family protein [Petrocella sp. FN5]|uniref:cyclase family protein n=1 Tax=Petrocella sp. FN5 TaxID=3032002 RepID=UPI0023DAFAB3|nr:cyclase family protein [Petrocella sp. FN5]MDF1616522.1 cyclase family protein [Petrocella sp. FN5]